MTCGQLLKNHRTGFYYLPDECGTIGCVFGYEPHPRCAAPFLLAPIGPAVFEHWLFFLARRWPDSDLHRHGTRFAKSYKLCTI